MKVCGYSTIVLLHRPCRQHRVGLPTHQRAKPEPTNGHNSGHFCQNNPYTPKKTQTGGGVGMVVEAGVCTERHIFTHLWADCCCSWRGCQRCCWMPWHGSPSGAEPLASVRLRVVRRAEEKTKVKSKESGGDENFLSSEMARNRESVCDHHRNPEPQACTERGSHQETFERKERRERAVESIRREELVSAGVPGNSPGQEMKGGAWEA